KSDYTTPYAYEFRVDGLISNLEERLNNDTLTLSWKSSILYNPENFAITLYTENFDSTFITSSSHISLERKALEPGDYQWTVSSVKNGKKHISEVKSFTIPPIAIEIESLTLDTNVNDFEGTISFTLVINRENYWGNLEYELQILDTNGTIVWNT